MIEGSLVNVPLADVLQLVTGGGKSGVLEVAREGVRARIYVDHGRIQVAHLRPGVHLGEIMVRMDLLTTREAQEILDRQEHEDAGTRLGLHAVLAGLIEEQDLHAALERQAVEVVAELLGWRTGSFAFSERTASASQVPTERTYDAMALLMEADALRQELDQGTAAPEAVYRRVGDPTQHTLPEGAWEVLAHVDGFRTARTVASEGDLGEERTLRVLTRLEELGVIEALVAEGPEPVVFVVSPSDARARLIRLALQRVGVRPMLFEQADAALAHLDEARPSVLVVEDHDGRAWELVRRLRSTPGRRHLPAVVLEARPAGWWTRLRRPKAHVVRLPFEELALQELVGRLAGRPLA